MRLRLMTAASMAPMCALALHGAAWAQATDTISTSTTANVSTATAVNGGPADIDIASGGSVNPGAGAAVTLNSNNNVSVEGSIGMNNVNNAIGIEETGNQTGSISNTGSISIGESFSASTNKDGYTYEPYAIGSGRYGIYTQGVLNGSVTAGSITVQGNNSYGVYIGDGLAGGTNGGTNGSGYLALAGGVSLTGDNLGGAAVYTAGEITGYVQITDTVTAHGQYTAGVQTTGTIDGALSVYSTVTSSGYATTTRPTTSTLLNEVESTPSQVEQGGSALIVQGSVGGGIFLGAPPENTASGSTADLDGDGIADGSEGTAIIETYGSAPAMVIGGTSPITIGQYGSANANGFGTGDNNFGLIVEGQILGSGIYDNVSATALDIGNGNGGVTITGGVRIAQTGIITATSYQSNATAILLEAGATVPTIQNEGAITATISASSTAVSANAVLIKSGATVNTFTNMGSITANVTGDYASAYGVVDQGGKITTFTNNGQITTSIAPTNATDTTYGSTVAVDLRYSPGVTFTQGAGGTDGIIQSITGDVYLSQTGPNVINFSEGTINGALFLGNDTSGNSAIYMSNGATYTGALTFGGSGIAVSLQSGSVLQDNSPTTINGKSLLVDGTSKLVFAIDPQLSQGYETNTQFNVGTATLNNGATIGTHFLSAPKSTQTFTLVQTNPGSLSAGSTTLATSSPFLYNTTAQANVAAGTVMLTVQLKTPAQLGLNKAETSALPAIYAALGQDSGIENALTNAATSSAFHSAYQLMLPDSAGDVFQVVTSMSKAVARASVGAAGFDGSGLVGSRGSTDDADDEEDDIGSQGGLWASEYVIGINQDRADNEAYRAVGLGLVGGLDFDGYGADISFASANVVKPHDPGDSIVSISRVEAGLYATPQFGILHTEARLAAGYLKISDRREFAADVSSGDLSTVSTVARTANGAWNGYDLSARLGASAPFDITRHFFMMPEAHLDVFDVSEGSYDEGGGGQGFDLDVSARHSTETAITAGVVAGLHYGTTFEFKPQLELGWDDAVTGGPGSTTAKFAYGGPSFTVAPNAVSGGAGVVRLRLNGDGEYVHFGLEAGGEFRSDYQNADIRAVFRISY